jgi:uncharacterized protein (DUF2164 family)
MYNTFDDNVELTTIEPEYTAMFCAAKKEVTFFYNNDIEESHAVETLEKADEMFEEWCQGKRDA